MTEKLKFTITYSETINTGNYSSKKYGLAQEFYEGTITVEHAFNLVRRDVKAMIEEGN